MAIHVAIRHLTRYDYDKSVHVSPQIIRLRPAPHSRTPILGYAMHISPKTYFINWQQDPFGNYMARIMFPEKIDHIEIDVEVIADMININPFDFFIEEYAEFFPFKYDEALSKQLSPYLEVTEAGPLLRQWLNAFEMPQKEQSTNFLVRINQQLNRDITYSIRMEAGVQDCETTLGRAVGSCRDTSWLLVQILRHLGLAARFVSGYLVQLKADEKPIEGPTGPEKDFTDLHAWTEVYIPGAGWIGLDPTSGLLTGEGHIPLSATPNPSSAAPVSGYTDPCQVTFHYENSVDRIHETPRVTKPYTAHQWQAITALGHDVEKSLEEGDVRLTMGGEPTFVSIDDRDAPEWNDDANGTTKPVLSLDLINKLKSSIAPQGLMHYGQGKWYPGEALPRWQYALYWRKDGHPIWNNSALLADPGTSSNLPYGTDKRFIEALCKRLGIDPEYLMPCYEDFYFFLWEKEKLPFHLSPEDLKESGSLAEKKMMNILDRGLERPAGYAVSLDFDYAAENWITSAWKFKLGNLFLIPGNSPVGLRLPLNRLPEELAVEDGIIEANPLDELPPLPIYGSAPTGSGENIPKAAVRKRIIKTALCVELREGRLYVFMPPLKSLESYLLLCSHIESTAAGLSIPVILEGYHPPSDYRLEKCIVGPDPGVVEVNMQPAGSWTDILNNYNTLFDLAKTSRLSPEKFMLDGRHTGTGGGNHITLGGSTPADSPLLRRPDLLRSFVNFWQNHPGLSYLFSSAFVGPTSQSPRVDEGRQEVLYELEIAFDQIDKYDNPPAWIVDRIFRNLLIDITGNTHRAEFCIDKLYNPDSASGRLGILEMRGFDMPPHKEMCMTQLLLVRTLVACFWKRPYRQRLVRWGTELHDKFLIHHYVREDLRDVVEYIQSSGFDFKLDWLEPFFEFRFPVLGELKVKDFRITLRSGIEPWNVLGEEMSNAGTARFVDSSVERVEVLVQGFNADRYTLLCNKTEVPLVPTAVKGTYVSGIRYKAWDPPSSLHPTIGVDVPIVFDIYDTWNQRSIGGCTYHVAHPGGRNYDTFPVNSFEAEGRRISRFWDYNHSSQQEIQVTNPSGPGNLTYRYTSEILEPAKDIEVKKIPPSLDYPHTFDLRRGK